MTGARVDRLDASFEALGGARIEDQGARISGEALHVELADGARIRAGVEIEHGRRLDHGDRGGERMPCREPRTEAAVEHASAFEAGPAEHPPEARGDRSPASS